MKSKAINSNIDKRILISNITMNCNPVRRTDFLMAIRILRPDYLMVVKLHFQPSISIGIRFMYFVYYYQIAIYLIVFLNSFNIGTYLYR